MFFEVQKKQQLNKRIFYYFYLKKISARFNDQIKNIFVVETFFNLTIMNNEF